MLTLGEVRNIYCIPIPGPFNLPEVTIKRIANLKEVPVPTMEVKVKKIDDCFHCCLCFYSDIIIIWLALRWLCILVFSKVVSKRCTSFYGTGSLLLG